MLPNYGSLTKILNITDDGHNQNGLSHGFLNLKTKTMANHPNSPKKNISVSAITVFAAGAAIVYFAALYYCYATGHFFEMEVLAAVMVFVAAFVLFIRRSLAGESDAHDELLTRSEKSAQNKSEAA